MKKYLLHIALIVFPFLSEATTYTSLTSGNWTNTTNVWSTDGSTPCLCAPSTTLNGDTVIIQDDINMDSGITAGGGTLITVKAIGSLSTISYTLTLNDADLEAFGNVTLKKLTIGSLAVVNLYMNVTLYIVNRMDVDGYLGLHHAYVYMDNGNVNVGSSGTLELIDGSNIFFENGNFNNFGSTDVCSDCCISVKGTVKNNAQASMSGGGSVTSNAGNIQNNGAFSNGIFWCSYGTSTGMPTPSNCVGAAGVCAGNVLPVELVSFTGVAHPEYNEIEWVTITELNCDYFVLERSLDGKTWEPVSTVEGAGTTTERRDYQVLDVVNTHETYYYRLWQFDFDERKNEAGTLTLEALKLNSAMIFPNPNNGEFTLMLGKLYPGTNARIYDVQGQLLDDIENISTDRTLVQSDLKSGIYQVVIESDEGSETIKFVVK